MVLGKGDLKVNRSVLIGIVIYYNQIAINLYKFKMWLSTGHHKIYNDPGNTKFEITKRWERKREISLMIYEWMNNGCRHNANLWIEYFVETYDHYVKSVLIWRVFLVRIFPHWEWKERDTPYFSVFSPNAGNTDQKNSEYGHFLRLRYDHISR